MADREKVIKEWEAVLSRDPLDAPWDLIDDTLTLLKEQAEEIENLKQTAQSMMEGIVISVPRENPCSSCQEFNCDFCGWKKYRN